MLKVVTGRHGRVYRLIESQSGKRHKFSYQRYDVKWSLRSSASWTAGQFLSFSSLPEALLFTETELGSEALQM